MIYSFSQQPVASNNSNWRRNAIVPTTRALVLLATCLSMMGSFAQELHWDIAPGTAGLGDGNLTGGSGHWNLIDGNWTTDNGANNVIWNQGSSGVAVFGGAAGTVTLDTAITIGGLRFDADGYSISGNSLLLDGPTVVTVGDGFDASIASVIEGTSGLTKSGQGRLYLRGQNSYQGPTSVNEGQIHLSNSGKLDAASSVTVAAGATLEGAGEVAGVVSCAGTLAPNSPTATLTCGSVDLTNGSLAIEVGGDSASRIESSGVINLSQTVLNVAEIAPATQLSFVIAEGSSITGNFVSTNLPDNYSLELSPTQVILHFTITNYEAWAGFHDLDTSYLSPYQNSDQDPMSNLLEYVLGGDPAGEGSGDSSVLPSITMDESSVFFKFDRFAASKSDTIQSVSISDDLIEWEEFTRIGNASEGAVNISSNGDTESVQVAIPRSAATQGKLFARLEVIDDFSIIAEEPGRTEVLRHWAPVVYQNVKEGNEFGRTLYGARDVFVAMNFDGDWDVANNWHNSRYQVYEQGLLSDRLTSPLQGKAYTSMVESEDFYFLTYGFYHSGQDAFLSAARHQNDWEVVILVVRKDATRFGELEGMMTQFHSDQNTYLPSQIQFVDQRPVVYIQPNGILNGHGIEAYSNQNPGSRGVVYNPGLFSENVITASLGSSGNWSTAPTYNYSLIPISEMWGLIGKNGLNDPYASWTGYNYARPANYPNYSHEDKGGNPPWNRDFFVDPFVFFSDRYPALQQEFASDSYLFNPYLNANSSQVGPHNPSSLLPGSTWQTSQLGGTNGLAWHHRKEATLFHLNGAGTGDRLTFSQVTTVGEFRIQGRLHSVQDLPGSRSGLMLRSSLAGTSRMAYLFVTPDQQVNLQYRDTDGGGLSSIISGPVPSTDQPVWIRLERRGSEIVASYSYREFGGSFTVLAAVPISLESDVLTGMASESSTTSYYTASSMTDLEIELAQP